MISIVFPHAINKENDRIIELKLKMFEANTTCQYEILYLANQKRPDLVYKGWNFLIENSKYDLVLWDNTDIVYSSGWNENVIKCQDKGDWIGLELVECGAIGVAASNIHKDFGRTAETFRREEFETWASEYTKSRSDYRDGFCWYSPSVFKKDWFKLMGGFPEQIPFPHPNDSLFKERVEERKQRFIVVNSIAYHFQRSGENQGLKPER